MASGVSFRENGTKGVRLISCESLGVKVELHVFEGFDRMLFIREGYIQIENMGLQLGSRVLSRVVARDGSVGQSLAVSIEVFDFVLDIFIKNNLFDLSVNNQEQGEIVLIKDGSCTVSPHK